MVGEVRMRNSRGGGFSRQPSAMGAGVSEVRQSVGGRPKKSKKWCILVHRRSLGTRVRAVRLGFVRCRARILPPFIEGAFPRAVHQKNRKSDAI